MPTVRLDAFNVRSLPALAGRRTHYRDDPGKPGGVRGLVLRVSPSGARSFALLYSRHHRNRTLTIGPLERVSLADARAQARLLFASILQGDDPQAARTAARGAELSVGDLLDRLLEGLELRDSTRRSWEWMAAKLVRPHLGRERAVELSRARIRAWGEALARKSAYNADGAFRLLRRAYSWAVERDVLPGTPFAHLPSPGRGLVAESDRVLDADELRLLLLALDDLPGAYADATRLLLLTVTRRENVLGMRWAEVDLRAGVWLIPAARMKGARPHVVPLVPAAVEILERQRRRGDAVFPPARGDAPAMAWSSRFVRALVARMEARRHAEQHGRPAPPPPPAASTGLAWPTYPRAPIPRWTIHQLRHTAATHLRERFGEIVDRDLVRLLLAHAAPPGATRVYDRAERLADRRRALEAWAGWLASLPRQGARASQRGSQRAERAVSGASRDARGTRGRR